ncbi:MAG: hypothetical protein JXM70_07860, partial [Pirellulales bacterium]|nr:hypothetical protein [Pirellulales bacterium]
MNPGGICRRFIGSDQSRWLVCGLIVGTLGLQLVACGGPRIPLKVIHGKVTSGGQKADTGRIRFVPIEGTPGPASAALIVDGQYRIEKRGGVPVGKHRVEVAAYKTSGRKVRGPAATGGGMVDERIPVGSQKYSGPQSTITVEITADSDGL